MILPDFWAMSRPAAARQPLKTPTRLTSMVRRNSSGAISAKDRTPAVPALLTRMSRRPRPWTARSARARAMARPSPRLAPVTMAALPSRRKASRAIRPVQGIEGRAVPVADHPALDLEGGRERPVFHREVLGQHEELLDLGVR